jgi:uracil-DNA glycosylase family protein
MAEPGTPVSELIPARPSLTTMAAAAHGCRACPLWRDATQTVFGEGSATARVMFVGEQPGDKEDLAGRPFVGPAGRLLDEALAEAGIDRSQVYVTNVVKHFKSVRKGKRRIHKTPAAQEVAACRPWLEAEVALVEPAVLVCLGATAAQAILGRSFRLTQHRGEFFGSDLGPLVTATLHPSAILRAPDEERRRQETARFVEDLRAVASRVARDGKTSRHASARRGE